MTQKPIFLVCPVLGKLSALGNSNANFIDTAWTKMTPTTPQRICVLRLSAIGDVCHAVAAVQAIQATYPNARITWIIGKIEHQLLKGLPGVEFIVFDKSSGRTAFRQLQADLNGRSFDILLHMQVALRANLAAALIRAKRKIGYDWQRAKEGHSLVINERIRAQTQAHVLESFFAFAEKIGVAESAKHQLSWNIPVSEDDRTFAGEQIPDNRKTFVIAPSASNAERNWTAQAYAQLADFAAAKGFSIILCGGPTASERQLGAEIAALSSVSLNNLIGQTTLKQLLALLARATLVLAPDTGPAHMAVTQGTPVIGLYAHSNPKRTGPYLYQDYVVEVYHQQLLKQYHKSQNQLPWGKRVKGKHLMAEITVAAVLAQFEKLCSDLRILESEQYKSAQ